MPDIVRALNSFRFWILTSAGCSFFIVKFRPEYSIAGSLILSALGLFFGQFFCWSFYYVLIYPNYTSPLRGLPQPKGVTFFNGHWAESIKEPAGLPFRRWNEEIPNDGLIRYLHLFNKERVIVTSPKGLGEVLTQKSYDFVKPYMLVAMVGKILGIGLLLAEGDEHKRQRKNLMPAFSFRHIKDLYPVFWSKAQEMVSGIEKELNQSAVKIVDMSDWASRASLDIIGLAGMGHDFGALADPSIEDTMKMYGGKVKQSRTGKLLTMLQLFFPIWLVDILPFDRNKGVHAVSRAARNTSRKLIKQKQEQIASGKPLSPDIISTALESGTFMEEGLVDSMMTFLAAGHETSAAAFTWTVYLLGQHREEQSRLRKEIKSGISSVTDTIDSNQLDGLPYLHAVCQESLRMYAPIPFTVRDANKDTSILGQFIPRGTMIIIGPWAINWSKDLWGPDAHTFNPERWMGAGRANSGGAVSNYANLTFLHGPRSCIGQKFSVAELASLVAAFVGRFEFELAYPDEKIDITDGIVAKPVNGMKVKVKAVEER